MKRSFLFFVLFVVSIGLSAQAEEWLWVNQAAGLSYEEARGIATDASGNSYVCGYFNGTTSFGGTSLSSTWEVDTFVAKLDPNGNWLWVSQAGGGSYAFGLDIAIDAAGNSYVCGWFMGIANFGSTSLTSVGPEDIFIAKLDPDGNWLWAQSAGGANYDNGIAIATDAAGNCYLSGWFQNTASYGDNSITSNGGNDIFIAKLDTNGNWLWVRQAGGRFDDSGRAVATDAAGNCYITGTFYYIASFGDTSLTSHGSLDIFIAKLDTNGNWLWVRQAGGTGNDSGSAVDTDAAGNCYVSGSFYGTANFGDINLTSNGDYDIYVAKLDPNGNWLRVSQAGGANRDTAQAIATDAVGNCYMSGDFQGTANFGSTSLTSSGEENIFVAKLDPEGNWLAARRAGGTDEDYGWGIALDQPGKIYVCGCFRETASFGNTSFTSDGDCDIFIAKLGVPDYQVLAPNGSENWYADTVQTVYWSSNSLSHVNVLLSLNNGQDWTLLNGDPVLTSLGSFSFIVPHVSSENCLIKVENAENGVCFDVSDACFSIRDETLPVELLSFTATITAENFVQINWTTGYETDLLGFSICRNAINEQSSAICVSPLIPACNCTYPQNYVFTDTDVEAGSWYYWLEALEFGGSQYLFGPLIVTLSNVGLQQTPGTAPVTGIKSIYPNPFNPRTTITIELSKPSNVQIGIYNLKGELIRKLDSSAKMAGIHNILWDGLDDSGGSCCSGIYLFRLTAEGKSSQAKLTLLK